MKDEFKKYLDKKFAGYKKSKELNDFKEETLLNLCERFEDFKKEGYTDKVSFEKSIELMGDYSGPLKDIEENIPKQIAANYTKLFWAISALYYMLLLIVYFIVSFIVGFAYTWVLLVLGTIAHIIFRFYLNSRNAVVNKNNSMIRLNISAIFFVLTTIVYLGFSFVTSKWATSWLIIVIAVAIWLTVDTLIQKQKNKKIYLTGRVLSLVMVWATAIYLTVSVLVGNIWSYSWLIFLVGIFINTVIISIRYYKKYQTAIKSDVKDEKTDSK